MKLKLISVARREVSLRRSSIIIFCVIVAFLAVLYTSIYPALQHQAAQLIHSIGNVYKDVGVQGKVSFSTLQSYISLEMFAVTWPILVTVFAASLSGAALAGEVEKGTLGMLLALPLKRTSIYFAKYLSGLFAIAIFVIATITPMLLIAKVDHLAFQFSHFATTAFLCFLFGMSVYSLALFFSAMFDEKTHLYGLIGCVMFIMYIFNAIAGLKPSLGGLKYVSFFHYFNASGSLVNNHISSSSYVIFIAVPVLSTVMGASLLKYRDFII